MFIKFKANRKKLIVLTSLFLFGFIQLSSAQSNTDKLDELLGLYQEYGQFNGSVLIAKEGKVIYKKGFGMANMEWDIPNTPDTKFRLGSITKQFTAMLILQLVEQGKLELDKPISNYLPDYPKANGDRITLHHLLTHSSGIPNYTSFPGFRDMNRNPYTPADFVATFADSTLEFDPGAQFAYSNSGYFLLGHIIEKTTGKSYEQVLQAQILDPLSMKNTGYDHFGTILKNRAAGYEKTGDGYINAPYLDMSLPYAAGSLYSTVEDLYLWDQALYTSKILSLPNMKLMFKPQIEAFGQHYAYGWGVGITKPEGMIDSMLTIGHGGGINGFNTLIGRMPNTKDLIVLLNNTGGTALNEISRSIMGILYNLPYDLPKRSLANNIVEAFMNEGVDAGLAKYENDKASGDYYLKENEMNAVGYKLLQAGKIKEAIAVFKLNVDNNINSSNAYDSLGEAYMLDQNKELAIKNYEKSIALNPSNLNGVDILKKLKAK
jgi:CubicO group peptidase (beta-lactamase class C family)